MVDARAGRYRRTTASPRSPALSSGLAGHHRRAGALRLEVGGRHAARVLQCPTQHREGIQPAVDTVIRIIRDLRRFAAVQSVRAAASPRIMDIGIRPGGGYAATGCSRQSRAAFVRWLESTRTLHRGKIGVWQGEAS